MPLQPNILKQAIKLAIDTAEQNALNGTDPKEALAEALAEAINTYLLTSTVNINFTGTSSVGLITGTGIGTLT